MKTGRCRRIMSFVLVLACFISTAALCTSSTSAAARDVIASNAEPDKNQYPIVSPVPSGTSISPITQPPRLDSLYGKTIALVGGSFSASVTHGVLRDMLKAEFGCKTYYMDEIGKGGTFDEHYNDIKNGLSTENVEADIVETTPVPEWLRGAVPFETIDTTQTISEGNTGFVITGGDISSQIQVMPGGDCCSYEVKLPGNWDTLTGQDGYSPIGDYSISR